MEFSSSHCDSFTSELFDTNYGFVQLDDTEFCYIDNETSRTLELLENNVDSSNRKHSLMGYLDANTSTTVGSRLIRESIIKPFNHLPSIEHRLDCIEYLVNRIDTLSSITNSIKRFGQGVDLNSVVPTLVNLYKTNSNTLNTAEKRLSAITTIEVLLSQVSVVLNALQGASQQSLNVYKIALEDPAYSEILDDIYNYIEPGSKSCKGKKNKMFRIKQGVESLFDVARSTYSAAINDLEQYVRELHSEDNLPWKLSHGETRGYYLTLSLDGSNKSIRLSEKYIQVNRSRNFISCTTREMMQSNVRANVSYENSMKLANEVLTAALAAIMSKSSAIYKLVDIIGMLDLITSFSKLVVTSNGQLVRPKFATNETCLRKSRHPVLESVLRMNDLTVVPNDISFNTGCRNFMLVTGPNMGGKSIFLKQVALIQIMAQIGCYVPAESARIKLVNRIVARSGTSDDNQSSCSSFMWEMRGIASAIEDERRALNQSALYVIDEVGRGTSIDDGASYSFAIAEELASRANSFTVFATHFDQVFCLTSLYKNIIAYHFKYEKENDIDKTKLKISHCLVPGFAEKNNYGIRLAEACGIPEEIIRAARNDSIIEITDTNRCY